MTFQSLPVKMATYFFSSERTLTETRDDHPGGKYPRGNHRRPPKEGQPQQETLRTRQRTGDNQTSVPGALHHRKPGLGLNDLRGKPSNRSKAAQEPGLKPGTGPRGQTPGHPNQAALLVLRSTAILLRAGSVPHALLAKGRCLPASTRPPLRPGIQLDPPTSPPHQGRRQRHCSVAASSCCC